MRLTVPTTFPNLVAYPAPSNFSSELRVSSQKGLSTLLKRMSTGKVRPGMWKMGTFPKKAANFSASIVADVTMSFRSERRATT